LIPPGVISLEAVTRVLWTIPITLAAIVFLIGMRRGYALHGASMKPVFLPPAFGKVVQYIREIQNREMPANRSSVNDVTNAFEE
jgi:hypothetical protein